MDKLFFRGLGIGLFSSLTLAILNLILTPVIINNLGLSDYGIVGIYTNWIMLVSILDVAISRTASREIGFYIGSNEKLSNLKVLFQTSESLYFLILALITIVAFLTMYVLNTVGNIFDLKDLVLYLFLILSGFFQLLSNFYFTCMIGFQKQASSALINCLFGSVRVIILIILLQTFKANLELYFLIYCLVFFLQSIIFRFAISKISNIDIKFNLNKEKLILLLKKSSIMIGIGISGIFASYSDKIFLSILVSLNEFAVYNLSWIVAASIFLITMPFSQGIEAKLSKIIGSNNKNELFTTFSKSTFLLYSLLVMFCYFISKYNLELISLWVDIGSKLELTSRLTSILIIGSFFVAISYPLTSLIISLNNANLIFKVNFFLVLVYLPFLYLFIQMYNMKGAAVLWAIYGFFIFIILTYFVNKLQKKLQIFKIITFNLVVPIITCFVVDHLINFLNLDYNNNLIFLAILVLKIVLTFFCIYLFFKNLYNIILLKKTN